MGMRKKGYKILEFSITDSWRIPEGFLKDSSEIELDMSPSEWHSRCEILVYFP